MAARESTTAKQAEERQAYQRRKTRARVKALAQQEAQRCQVQGLPVTQAHAAGIDIGAGSRPRSSRTGTVTALWISMTAAHGSVDLPRDSP